MNSTESLLQTQINVAAGEVDIVEIPFHAPVHLPFGTIETRPSAWLKLIGEVDGQAGVGAAEGTSLPMQIPLYDDCSGNLRRNIEQIVDELTDRDASVQEIRGIIADTELGGTFATARLTVEAAVLDLVSRTRGTTMYELLTGEKLEGPLTVAYGKSIAEADYDNIVIAALTASERGARRLKFKLSPSNHQAAVDALSYLKAELPEADLMVDANGMFDPENASHLVTLKTVDKLGLMMIEEPVSRAGRLRGLDAHRALHKAVDLVTPIALDDSVMSRGDAQAALQENLGTILNLKPGRVGSFLDCVDIAMLAKQQDKQIMVGGMFEATPGRMMTLTLAALCLREGFTIPGDVSLPQERLAQDIGETVLRLDNACNVVFAPQAGWGYAL